MRVGEKKGRGGGKTQMGRGAGQHPHRTEKGGRFFLTEKKNRGGGRVEPRGNGGGPQGRKRLVLKYGLSAKKSGKKPGHRVSAGKTRLSALWRADQGETGDGSRQIKAAAKGAKPRTGAKLWVWVQGQAHQTPRVTKGREKGGKEGQAGIEDQACG